MTDQRFTTTDIEGRSHSIKRSLANGTKVSLLANSGQPFDIAIDIIGRLLFWTCSYSNSINVTIRTIVFLKRCLF
ncbi:GL20311 [Drosophila persimilis]|uniref:GL20311 n=1 Tax=Drosophila persimilis TaxID=7234 RepID=B4GXL6_DROPE|nr:GL20311 [Drosophila persimilis]